MAGRHLPACRADRHLACWPMKEGALVGTGLGYCTDTPNDMDPVRTPPSLFTWISAQLPGFCKACVCCKHAIRHQMHAIACSLAISMPFKGERRVALLRTLSHS